MLRRKTHFIQFLLQPAVSSFTQYLIENVNFLQKIEFQACFIHFSFVRVSFVFELFSKVLDSCLHGDFCMRSLLYLCSCPSIVTTLSGNIYFREQWLNDYTAHSFVSLLMNNAVTYEQKGIGRCNTKRLYQRLQRAQLLGGAFSVAGLQHWRKQR